MDLLFRLLPVDAKSSLVDGVDEIASSGMVTAVTVDVIIMVVLFHSLPCRQSSKISLVVRDVNCRLELVEMRQVVKTNYLYSSRWR